MNKRHIHTKQSHSFPQSLIPKNSILKLLFIPHNKKVKKISAKIKEIILTTPKTTSFCLKETIPFNNGKNSNAIKPIAALIPCIFEAIVTMSLFSFTLNIPEITPAPTAKIPIESDIKTDKTGNSVLITKKYTTAVNNKKHPSHINHAL